MEVFADISQDRRPLDPQFLEAAIAPIACCESAPGPGGWRGRDTISMDDFISGEPRTHSEAEFVTLLRTTECSDKTVNSLDALFISVPLSSARERG